MFWTINSITEAKEQFPTLSSLWDETMSGNSLGNMTDADINWDYLYEKVTGNSFSVQPDYRIPAENARKTIVETIANGLYRKSISYLINL
jgi:hypothetical protein